MKQFASDIERSTPEPCWPVVFTFQSPPSRNRMPRWYSVRPAEIGLIASLGIGEVRVRRRLRVAFFSTGDELVSIGAAPKEGEVYDSNRYTLHGMLSRLGVEIHDLGVVRDDPAQLEAAFRKAAECADCLLYTSDAADE